MISIADFAKLAQYSYKSFFTVKGELADFISHGPILGEKFQPKLLKSGFYEVIIDKTTQHSHPKLFPFYASLFVKVQHYQAKAAVIAIRGTVPTILDNDIQDIKSWWRSVFDDNARVILPKSYVESALRFYNKVRNYTSDSLNLPCTNLYVTGHSLGGAIAALLPAYCHLAIRAVTFDAPGIKDIAGAENVSDRIINFRANYDFFSALDYPIGPCIGIEVRDHENQAKQAFAIADEHRVNEWSRLDIVNDLLETTDFLGSVLPQHSTSNLVSALEQSPYNHHLATMDYSNVESRLDHLLVPPFGEDYVLGSGK